VSIDSFAGLACQSGSSTSMMRVVTPSQSDLLAPCWKRLLSVLNLSRFVADVYTVFGEMRYCVPEGTEARDHGVSWTGHSRVSRRDGPEIRSTGRRCSVEWAQMLARLGADVSGMGGGRPVGRSDVQPPGLSIVPRRSGAPTTIARRRMSAHRTAHSWPVGGGFAPGRPDIPARSTRHSCPVDPTFLPARPAGSCALG
jgi:hypothetical protein